MNVTAILKKLLLHLPLFASFALLLTRNKPRIFMYHRFCDAHELADGRIDQNTFKWQLKQLQKGWNIMTLGDFLKMKEENVNLPPYIVILTVDDGYEDFYRIAYPCLKEYGLSATFFPTVNFIEGGWLWWDRISFALEQTLKKNISFEFKSKTFRWDLTTHEGRQAAWMELSAYCINIKDDIKHELILHLEKELVVKLPPTPPSEFAAVTWENLREMRKYRIEIGGHTLSHPITSQISEDVLVKELVKSKEIIESNLNANVVSFCYPNGTPADINDAICKHVRDVGYKAAVVTTPSVEQLKKPFDPYRIPRMGVGRDKVDFLWKLCGMENLIREIKLLN